MAVKTALLALLLSLPASGLTLEWEPAEHARDYRVWLGIEVVAVSTTTEAVVNVPSWSTLTFVVTARNYDEESAPSDPLTVCLVEPRITLEFSADLQHWTEQFSPASRFARARKDSP